MRFPFPPRAAIALCLSLGCMTPVMAEVSITYSIPGVSFGLNLGGYPVLQRIPGYPVYYAPRLACRCAAAVGRALGPLLARAPAGLGSLGSPQFPGCRAAAQLPAQLSG